MDQIKLAKEVVDALGGAQNISSVYYCMTRLRVYLEDESLADDERIKNIEDVKGLVKLDNYYQIIVGSEVIKVYPEVKKILKKPRKDDHYQIVANDVVSALGGVNNIVSVTHCMTRLRVYIEDKSLANEEIIKNIEDVKGLTVIDHDYQVVFGTVVDKIQPEVDKILKHHKNK